MKICVPEDNRKGGKDSQGETIFSLTQNQETELMLQWWKFASPQFFSRVTLQVLEQKLNNSSVSVKGGGVWGGSCKTVAHKTPARLLIYR